MCVSPPSLALAAALAFLSVLISAAGAKEAQPDPARGREMGLAAHRGVGRT
jgi:hypothetical protein